MKLVELMDADGEVVLVNPAKVLWLSPTKTRSVIRDDGTYVDEPATNIVMDGNLHLKVRDDIQTVAKWLEAVATTSS